MLFDKVRALRECAQPAQNDGDVFAAQVRVGELDELRAHEGVGGLRVPGRPGRRAPGRYFGLSGANLS